MRKYKAVVIDLKRLIHRGSLLVSGFAAGLIAIYVAGGFNIVNIAPDKILKECIPVYDTGGISVIEHIKEFGIHIAEYVTGFLPGDRRSVINYTLTAGNFADRGELNLTERNGTSRQKSQTKVMLSQEIFNIPEENRAPIKSIDAAQKVSQENKIAIGNETSYRINIEEMLSGTLNINMDKNGPKVLITHTHATESYAPKGAEVYDITASDRSEDRDKNVVAVGRRMKKILEENGIETLHDEILHDVPSFNGSYAHSLNTVEEYMKKYPSIQIVFDLHRDSIVYDDNTKAKTVTVIDGKNAAQLMFVVGTDENGLYNPKWRDNMQAAIHFQTAIVQKYPSLMRYINLRRERFNGHTSSASMIIEVGTSGNSLDEALYSIELATECIVDYLRLL